MSEEISTPRHRWLRFGLRTMLLLLTLFAVAMAWIAKEQRQSAYERRVAERLLRQGFRSVALGGRFDVFGPQSPNQPQVWWRNAVRPLLGDRIIMAVDPQSSFDDWEVFSELTNLQMLCLDKTRFSDLTLLDDLTSLRWLSLNKTAISDLKPLVGHSKLQQLFIDSTKVKDLTTLATLNDLETVSVGRTEVTDLSPLLKLSKLKCLWAHYMAVDREQVAAIQKAFPDCKIRHWTR